MAAAISSPEDNAPFFVLHKATSKKFSKKSVRRKVEDTPSKCQRLDSEDSADGFHQSEAFEIVWSKIEKTIKDVLKNINHDAFSEIYSWILESFQAIKSVKSLSPSEATRSFPAAIDPASKRLFTGLVLTRNMEFVDDLMTFEDLAHHLKSRGCHVANLSSLDFSSDNGIVGCIRSLLKQFLSSAVDAADISVLSLWYHALGNRDAPIVVIINDLERCCGSVLSDFIIMLSEWVVKIPVILIFGVATTLDVLGNILHFNSLQRLCSAKFTLRTPVERMDAVTEAVLVKNCSRFSIGHKVVAFLKNYFTSQDGTLSTFIRALKISCAQHFAAEPLNCVLKGFEEAESKGFLENHGSLREAISKYNGNVTSCTRSKTEESGGQNLVSALAELKKWQDRWSSIFMCLYEAGKCNHIHLLELLSEVLDPDIFAERYMDGHSTFKNGTFMCKAVQTMRDLSEPHLIKLLKSWEKHVMTIPEIHSKVKDLQHMLKFENSKRRKEPNTAKLPTSQNRLNVQRGPKAVNDSAVDLIVCLINEFMQPMESVPFHEIICFKDVLKLKAALAGDPRRQIQVDLLGSHRTLRCSCCDRGNKVLSPSMQDTSIMYTLCQEHGDVINVYDWYESFKLILQPSSKGKQKRKQPKKTKGIDEEKLSEAEIQARFCRAVTELQVTGVLRMQSKRRPDYLQRVAFGL